MTRMPVQKSIIKAVVPLLVMSGAILLLSAAASAATPVSPGELPKVPTTSDTIRIILRIAFGILGAFALLGITLSGMKYIASAGDPQKASEAKNGIIYALVGLIVAITAEALVVFIVKGAG